MAAYTQNMTAGSPVAASWGSSIDMSSMPSWAYNVVAENVMYSRNFLAANPDVLSADGSVNLGASNGPLMIPQDLSAVLASSSSSSASSSSPTSSADSSGSATGGSSASASATGTPSSSGANSLAASMALASVVALVTAFFAL